MLLNKPKRKWLPVFIILISVLANSCYYDKEELLYPAGSSPGPTACGTTPASFSADVLPLMTAKCAISGCHDATASGGFTFQNYNQISSAKELINVQAVIQKTMPASGSLSPAEINTLKCWIGNGGLNN